ncbi:MAG: hypothetical protein L6301_01725 [Desulfobacteraceae bacterium]|nr:hypothetical protein [Pseudomonadota bacterium]MCG2750546.1 hypothetical protein [Desulfobacteraceae bacterium]
MTKTFIHLLILIMLPLYSVAGDAASKMSVLAVQSLRVGPYEQAMEGFEKAFSGKIHKILLEENPKSHLQEDIKAKNPDLILAMGLSALTQVMTVRHIPVLYLMVLDPPAEAQKARNITGISMSVSPDVQLELVQKILPGVKTIGMLYDPHKSDSFVKLAREAAAKKNFLLLDRPTENPKQMAENFNSMKDRMDLYWMIPDTRLLAGENIELLHILSLENKVPILTFSEKFMEMGSLMSIGIDPFDVGRQGGELAEKILLQPESERTGCGCAEKPVVTVNKKILKKLGIPMNYEDTKDLDMTLKR